VCDLESSPVRWLRLDLGCCPQPPSPPTRKREKAKTYRNAFVSNDLRYVKELSFGGSQVSAACLSDKSIIEIGETEELGENSFQFLFVPTDCTIEK
jgi:hypothetical protein